MVSITAATLAILIEVLPGFPQSVITNTGISVSENDRFLSNPFRFIFLPFDAIGLATDSSIKEPLKSKFRLKESIISFTVFYGKMFKTLNHCKRRIKRKIVQIPLDFIFHCIYVHFNKQYFKTIIPPFSSYSFLPFMIEIRWRDLNDCSPLSTLEFILNKWPREPTPG